MKKKFILAAILAITIKGCLIYFAIEASTHTNDNWKTGAKAGFVNGVTVKSLIFLSPSFSIEELYRPLQGPSSEHRFRIDSSISEFVWIAGYSVNVVDARRGTTLPDDFICHNHLGFDLTAHSLRPITGKRMDDACPGLITLTQGQTALKFPRGFGLPVFSDEPMSIFTQALNDHLPEPNLLVNHKIKLDYVAHAPGEIRMKPLFERSVFVLHPMDEKNVHEKFPNPRGCIPARSPDSNGTVLSAHWIIQPGKQEYHCNVTSMMNLPYDTRLHYIGTYTLPYAQSFELRNITLDSTIFVAACTNFNKKTGLKSTGSFTSENGIPVFQLHEYELIIKVNNSSGVERDMIAGMFLYFYDAEMDHILTEKF